MSKYNSQTTTTPSPLLSLPFPLRDFIWRHAFGQSLLHVHYSPDTLRFTTFFCQEAHPPPQSPPSPIGPTLALHPTIPDIYSPRHPSCQSHLDARQRGHHDYGPNHNLGALFVCRQFYSEIQPVLYGTNIFQVESAISFSALIEVLNRHRNLDQAQQSSPWDETPNLRLALPKLTVRLEILMFSDPISRHWPLVLTPLSLLWVEAHVSRLEISGYITQRDCPIASRALQSWCSALEVPHYRQDLCIVETATDLEDHELRPPSPDRSRFRRTERERLLRDVRQLGVRGSNASPAFHIRSALAKLSGRMMTMEEYIDQQVLGSADGASQAYYKT